MSSTEQTQHTGEPQRISTVELGNNGPLVGVQGLGCMGMSWAYGPTDADEARATLERGLELGVTLYDTADAYAAGENEKFLAPFLKAHRDEVVLATKFALGVDPSDPTKRLINNDPAYIRACIDASLQRLGVDTIDLYYMHRRDVNVPIEETVGVMAELVAAGKVKHLGLSEVTGGELRAAQAVHPIAALQSEWSLFSRDIEKEVVPTAAELGVALVPYSPLGRGFLTGSFVSADKELDPDDFRRQQPRFTGDNAAANAVLLEPVRQVAEAHGASSARSPWPGCSSSRRPSDSLSSRSPAPASEAASRRTPRPPASPSPTTNSPWSPPSLPRSRATATPT